MNARAAIKLVLEDGTEMFGRPFGAAGSVGGEVVFNTAMSGYVEALTDPSYRGQILVLTYPLVGSYGVPAPRARGSLDGPYESGRVQVQGLVVQSYVDKYSHHAATRSLGAWLEAEGVPGITGIDTRTLTRRLREHGTMKGWLVTAKDAAARARNAAETVDMKEVFRLVAPENVIRYEGDGPLNVLLVDAGAKDNIVRSLLKRGATGGDTYKLPYGHRGVNQPVQDLLTRRCYITSQNHGFAVKQEALPGDWEPWFVNVNDGTSEGIRARTRPFFSVQFHPEASPGPEDTAFLFDDFMRLIGAMARG